MQAVARIRTKCITEEANLKRDKEQTVCSNKKPSAPGRGGGGGGVGGVKK